MPWAVGIPVVVAAVVADSILVVVTAAAIHEIANVQILTLSHCFFPVCNLAETVADTASPQEGCMGPKFMTNYIAALLLLLSVCAILIVAELGSLVSFASKSSSPGTLLTRVL
jgi:hypothetical protein